MLLEDIGTFLQDEGEGTLATDLFLGEYPPSPDDLVALMDTGGLAPVMEHGVAIAVARPTLQVFVRNVSPTLVRTKAKAVHDKLAGVTNRTLSGTRYLSISPIQPPFSLGRDANDRYQQVCNFQVSHNA